MTYNYDSAKASWAVQRKLMRAPLLGFNAEVQRWFKAEDATASRNTLRDSLLITTKDSRSAAMQKVWYFREFIQKVQYKPTIIGAIKNNVDESMEYKCEVELYFEQDAGSVVNGNSPISAETSFRLDVTAQSLTQTKIAALAAAIKKELVASKKGYAWSKGKHICWYVKPSEGYHLQIYAINETEGEKVVKKILAIQNHTYDDKIFKISSPKRSSDNTPGNTSILGKTYKKKRWRPSAVVRFQHAMLKVHGLPEPICLVDLTGKYPKAAIKAWI